MNDASNFALGFSIVFIYVMLMLGKCNLVEQRVYTIHINRIKSLNER